MIDACSRAPQHSLSIYSIATTIASNTPAPSDTSSPSLLLSTYLAELWPPLISETLTRSNLLISPLPLPLHTSPLSPYPATLPRISSFYSQVNNTLQHTHHELRYFPRWNSHRGLELLHSNQLSQRPRAWRSHESKAGRKGRERLCLACPYPECERSMYTFTIPLPFESPQYTIQTHETAQFQAQGANRHNRANPHPPKRPALRLQRAPGLHRLPASEPARPPATLQPRPNEPRKTAPAAPAPREPPHAKQHFRPSRPRSLKQEQRTR
jgi:hypothetical protein